MGAVGVVKMEKWEFTYIAVLFIGLLIGWKINPYVGVALVWAVIVICEVYSGKETKKSARKG
jgi:CHASE2 domain-containing sensor protein